MRELTDRALNLAQVQGATYADIRIVGRETEEITVKNGVVQELELNSTQGFGVRVIADGAWGFAYNTRLNKDAVAETAKLAVETAMASAKAPKERPAAMAAEEGRVETLIGPCEEDPFTVSNKEKAELLLTACDIMLGVPGVVMARGILQCMPLRIIDVD